MKYVRFTFFTGLALAAVAFGSFSRDVAQPASPAVAPQALASKPSAKAIESKPRALAAPSEADSRIVLQPPDLSTSVATTPLRVVVDSPDLSIAAATAEALAGLVRLELEPEGTPVDVEVVPYVARERPVPIDSTRPKDAPMPAEPPADPDAELTYVEISPTAPLAERWYRLTLRSLPANVVADKGSARERGDEVFARFHPGSAPTLRRVTVCEKGGKHRATAEYSENVSPTARAPGVRVEQPSRRSSCALVSSDTDLQASPALYVDYDCGRLDTAAPVRFGFKPEVPAMSGQRAGLVGRANQPVELLAKLQDLPRDAEGCATWLP